MEQTVVCVSGVSVSSQCVFKLCHFGVLGTIDWQEFNNWPLVENHCLHLQLF